VKTGAPLDPKTCDRARIARDRRFDGAFYTGVLTTRIYCRPTCPVKPAKSENVVFFPTAAAAERAGFRPCLRCRPETAPGTPAWRGAAATVSRALRLIERGFLDGEARVEDLADALGMTARHLRRLFLRHAGASPTAVATTRRVQRAKRLVDSTAMPMAAVAFAAGFASIRRFNAAFRSVYRRSPTSVRRARLKRSGHRTGLAAGITIAEIGSPSGQALPRPGRRGNLPPGGADHGEGHADRGDEHRARGRGRVPRLVRHRAPAGAPARSGLPGV
jgi:AraC family transcriptional regulator of adaptative response / DNA-3-methyladenine glycosylase II